MTANEIIEDRLIRHTIYLLRLTTNYQDAFVSVLNKSNPGLGTFLYENMGKLSLARTKTAQKQWEAFRKRLYSFRSDIFTGFKSQYSDEMIELIDRETKYINALYNNSVNILEWNPNMPKTKNVNLLRYGQVDGKIFNDYFQEVQYGDTDRITKTVRTGLIQQKSQPDIVKDIVGTKSLNYTDGITKISKNSARSLTRTLTLGIANNARQEFYDANADVIRNEVYAAVLDGRTTLECASYDGTRWKHNEGPVPPLHRNCRSLRIAEVDGLKITGQRSYVTDTRTARKRRIDFRKNAKSSVGKEKWSKLSEKQRYNLIKKQRIKWQKENIGRVPVGTKAEDWLRNQPAKYQNEYLGKTRAELFRKGDFTLNKFIDKSGKKYNLDELYNIYTEEFKKAGISYP